jgi:hypothetical protein
LTSHRLRELQKQRFQRNKENQLLTRVLRIKPETLTVKNRWLTFFNTTKFKLWQLLETS